MPEAMLYKELENDRAGCSVCAHHCQIAPGDCGICGVRFNDDGVLHTTVYGRAAALNVDPIEKKPLFHFLPGSSSLSIGTIGCNFKCSFCQNWEISQYLEEGYNGNGGPEYPGVELQPHVLVGRAVDKRYESISFTYNEPAVFFEYAFDTARLARESGVKTVFVSNGYLTPESLQQIAPVLDAINIDLKSFDDAFYREQCQARLAPVLECITLAHQLGIWVEVTTLVIPGMNDTPGELSAIAGYIAGISDSIPWHITAFHPDHKMLDRRRTRLGEIQLGVKLGKQAGLKYVYTGNIFDDTGGSTFCPGCNEQLVRRSPFASTDVSLVKGQCGNCGEQVEGVWE